MTTRTVTSHAPENVYKGKFSLRQHSPGTTTKLRAHDLRTHQSGVTPVSTNRQPIGALGREGDPSSPMVSGIPGRHPRVLSVPEKVAASIDCIHLNAVMAALAGDDLARLPNIPADFLERTSSADQLSVGRKRRFRELAILSHHIPLAGELEVRLVSARRS